MIEYTASDRLAILCLQAPPVNAISFALLDELLAAIRRAGDDPEVQAIVITGGPEHFSAGADLAIFREIRCGDDAVRVSRVFQEAFQEIEDSPKPVVAALAGHVLGGALELAMACHFRVAAAGSRFSMPEVRLGINPGAGGTQRLPRLVGPEAALDMLLSGRPIDAERALALGLVDCGLRARHARCRCARLSSLVCDAAGRQDAACCRRTRSQDAAANRAAFAKADKLVAAVRPEIIAPRKIAEAIRIGIEQSFEAGLRREQVAFASAWPPRHAEQDLCVLCQSADGQDLGQAGTTRRRVDSRRPDRARRRAGHGHDGHGNRPGAAGGRHLGDRLRRRARRRSTGRLEKIRGSLDGRVRQGKLTAAQAEQMTGRLRVTHRLSVAGRRPIGRRSSVRRRRSQARLPSHGSRTCARPRRSSPPTRRP